MAELALPVKEQAYSRRDYSKLPQVLNVPKLVEVQLDSYIVLQENGIKELLKELSPIVVLQGTGSSLASRVMNFGNPGLLKQSATKETRRIQFPFTLKLACWSSRPVKSKNRLICSSAMFL